MSGCPHFDLNNPDTYRGGQPREIYQYLRREQPVYWHEPSADLPGYWVITRQADLDLVSKNPQLFSSAERTCMLHEPDEGDLELMRTQMINMDPPNHLKYRRLVRSAFTPRKVDSYEPGFRKLAVDIVERAVQGGRCDFVEDVAAGLPLMAICELMGVPQDKRQRLFELTNIMIGMDDPDLAMSKEDGMNAMIEMFMIGMEIAATHREHPEDDIVSVLLNGTVEEEPLTDDEFCNFFLLLIVAGNETTRTVTSHGMRLLLEHPDQYQQLVDNPALIPDAIEEFLRYNPAVIAFRRTAMADTEIGGVAIKKGDRVQLFYAAASSDENVFADPERFDILRNQREDVRNEHRAFGIGQHFCMGSHLARLELRVIFEEIVRRIRNPRLDGDIDWLRSNFINGIKHMPITFDTVA
ncbi:cytochrome P450 [Kineobactrum sediminis]|uniref:Cytochrome P450 n=1 Tax=Kineobactrum sediminis TaxID=1905677 RepID=A0A2N5Y2I4_9GAMM|nr:cytochrome P450 [Kineobactrum sediminis]PLW82597.1 cytochrome P450 [Kineobactrum sediminis]